MARLSRIYQKLFARFAPTAEVGEFGSFAEGTPTTTKDPAVMQDLSNWEDGWYSAVVAKNAPTLQDMNAVHFVAFYQLAYLFENGISEWDSETTYFIGSMVKDSSGSLIFVSLVDDNLNNSLDDTTKWILYNSRVRTVTTNTVLTKTDSLLRSNSSSGNLTHTLPSVASVPVGQRFTIKDVGNGSFATGVIGSGSELIDGNNVYATNLGQYASITVINNGTSWDVI